MVSGATEAVPGHRREVCEDITGHLVASIRSQRQKKTRKNVSLLVMQQRVLSYEKESDDKNRTLSSSLQKRLLLVQCLAKLRRYAAGIVGEEEKCIESHTWYLKCQVSD